MALDIADIFIVDTGTTNPRLILLDGLSTTIDTSINIGAVDDDARGITYEDINGNPTWAGNQANKLYIQSAVFTSTVKDSLSTSNFGLGEFTPNGVSNSRNGDHWFVGQAADRVRRLSQFTSTVKDSLNVNTLLSELAPHDLSVDATNLSISGNTNDRIWLLAGVNPMTTTILDSQSSPSTNPGGISYDGTDAYVLEMTPDIVYRLSGQFTSTIKAQADITSITTTPDGMEHANWGGRLPFVPAVNLRSTSQLTALPGFSFEASATLPSTSEVNATSGRPEGEINFSITGHITHTSFTDLFTKGKGVERHEFNLFEAVDELGSISGEATLFAEGAGASQDVGTIPLFTEVTPTDPGLSLNLYVESKLIGEYNDNMNLYIYNDDIKTETITMFMLGPSGINDSIPLHILGPIDGTSGWMPANDNLNLFIGTPGLFEYNDLIPMYLQTIAAEVSGMPTMYVDGVFKSNENVTQYIQGKDFTSGSIRIFIGGH